MQYSVCWDLKLSRLGFGAMRLPLLEDGKTIDAAQVEAMVDYAMAHGVNYFDTAYPYHNGWSEVVLCQALRKYPRDSYFLANKYPGHQPSEKYDPAAVFEDQLKKCGVEYFDFYLMHNVYENSIGVYEDPQWGIVDYFIEQKRLGRIRHLGFSCHGSLDVINEFLDYCGGAMEFCQIQLNYLDWTLQKGREKYELLTERGLPVIIMEPVRGGKLATLRAEAEQQLKALRPEESMPAWSFRFLQKLPNVAVVLSGMSNMAQMVDNVNTFSGGEPQSEEETALLLTLAEDMKSGVPCTACRYCCDGCPAGLDIPHLLSIYNEMQLDAAVTVVMRLDHLPPEKQASACIGCGACSQVCPQHIDIPGTLSDLTQRLKNVTSWAEICRQREAARKAELEKK